MTPATAIMLLSAFVATTARAATTTEGGYEVTRNQTILPVPHGKLGHKTIDRETRVGVTADTDGNSTQGTMTLGGFIGRCPVAEGREPGKYVVLGDFEFSVVSDATNTDVVPTERKHHAKRVTARVKGYVNDDLSVAEAEIEGEFSTDLDGVRSGPIPYRRRFRLRADGMPDMDALMEVVTVTSDVATAALIWNASTVILGAQSSWREPNACAELQFEPPGETRAVTSGEAVEIRVRYRSRDGQQPIPKGVWDAAVIQGGQVPKASGQVQPDGTFLIHYVARSSSAPQDGDGVRVEVWSAAGYAREIWKVRTALNLAIEHRIGTRRDTLAAKGGWAIFDGTARFDLRLNPSAAVPGEFEGTTTFTRNLVVSHVTPKCTGRASQVEVWRVVAEVAPGSGNLQVHVDSYVESGEGWWSCGLGDRDELNVHVYSEFDYPDTLTMPAASGTRRQFSRRGDEFEETLTVSIP